MWIISQGGVPGVEEGQRCSLAVWFPHLIICVSPPTVFNYSFFLGRRVEFASPSCLFCRNWAAGADGGSCRAGRNEGGCGRIPPEASSTSGGESENERNTSTCSSIPLPSLVVPPTPLPRHHGCVLKKFVALETERRSTHTVFFMLFLSQKLWMVRWHVAFRTSHVHQTTRNNDQMTDDYNWPIRHGNGPRWSVSDLKKITKQRREWR